MAVDPGVVASAHPGGPICTRARDPRRAARRAGDPFPAGAPGRRRRCLHRQDGLRGPVMDDLDGHHGAARVPGRAARPGYARRPPDRPAGSMGADRAAHGPGTSWCSCPGTVSSRAKRSSTDRTRTPRRSCACISSAMAGSRGACSPGGDRPMRPESPRRAVGISMPSDGRRGRWVRAGSHGRDGATRDREGNAMPLGRT